MSAEERKRILEMVQNGKITADQALTLMKAIEADAAAEGQEAPFDADSGADAGSRAGPSIAPELEQTAAWARRMAQVPLLVGIVLVVLSAWGMYSAQQSAGLGFWFYCLSLPLLLGVAATALGAWSRKARWLFVRVQNAPDESGPKNIFLGFPLPLDLAGWLLRVFGKYIQGLENTNVDEVVQVLSLSKSIHEPLIVNVDEGANGERVQVYIG